MEVLARDHVYITSQRRGHRLWMLAFLVLALTFAHCAEIVYIPPPESAHDARYEYSEHLLNLVMQRTATEFGPAEVRRSANFMTRDRVLAELARGQMIQVADAPTRPDFEQALLPVRIPIRKGIVGYRLLLIDAANQALFDKVQSAADLKRLRAASGSQWALTPILQRQGFKLATALQYEDLFRMLLSGDVDYFPRGVNEIFEEFDQRKAKMPAMQIERKIALYVPLPTYFFVSPARPELAKRITAGLEAMIKDGSFDQFFMHEYGEIIQRSNLSGRKVFVIDNPFLSPQTPLKRKELWYQPGGALTK